MLSIVKSIALCVACVIGSDALLTMGINHGKDAYYKGKGKEVYNEKKSAK